MPGAFLRVMNKFIRYFGLTVLEFSNLSLLISFITYCRLYLQLMFACILLTIIKSLIRGKEKTEKTRTLNL